MIFTCVDEYLDRAESHGKPYTGTSHFGYVEENPMVATSGAFDIITPGHIELFRTMRKLGSYTVVLLNYDESIKQYKNAARPVKPWEDRAVILDSIKFVDIVIGMPENTPVEAIRKLKPDIWVKGNRPLEEIVEGETVWANNGKVVCLWTNLEQSTTGYVEKAYQVYRLETEPEPII
jgi:rfaE bifunctional protein nucleotidyltransferase chain/domain